MKKIIFVTCIILALGSLVSINTFAQVYSKNAVGYDLDGMPSGIFCNVNKAGVCIITRNEEDCKKLNGVKVDSCPIAEESEK